MIALANRRDVPAEYWNALVEAHAHGWWWHTTHWLDYCLAYAPGSVDRSFAVIVDTKVAAVIPLVLLDGKMSFGGQPFFAGPIFANDNQAVMQFAWEEATVRAGREALRISARPGWTSPPGAPPGGRRVDYLTHVIALTDGSEEAQWTRVRKSYKSLIRSTERDCKIKIETSGRIALAHALHVAAAKRETRSQATWNLMAAWVKDGHAFVVEAYNGGGVGVGYAYVIYWKEWAYYASGACLEADRSHALQWHALRLLREAGCKYYEIGHDAPANASKKEQGIAHFKAGFGGGVMRVVAVEPDATPIRKVGGLRRE